MRFSEDYLNKLDSGSPSSRTRRQIRYPVASEQAAMAISVIMPASRSQDAR